MSYRNTTTLVTLGLAFMVPVPTVAQLTNIATVTASYGGQTYSASDDEAVDVVPAAPNLTITKTVKESSDDEGADDRWDAGDTITYQYVIKNDGNVTLTGVTPVDVGPTFNGQAATGSLGAFVLVGSDPVVNTVELAPDATATFEAVYTLGKLDVYHAADIHGLDDEAKKLVVNEATSKGIKPDESVHEDEDKSTVAFALSPTPEISLVKAAVLNDVGEDDDQAQVGETITYTYTVTNTGNVPLQGISIADIHEDAALASGLIVAETLTTEGPLAAVGTTKTSTDASKDETIAADGTWDLLQPEAVVTFTYVHTVTQAEVDGG